MPYFKNGKYNNITEYFTPAISVPESNIKKEEGYVKKLVLEKTRTDVKNTRNPKVWGPSLWLFLHISSVNYTPTTPEKIEMCVEFVKSLPYMLPCDNCSEHAKQYVKENSEKLVEICSSRERLFNFYVDMHNYVNARHGKRVFTYEEAWNMYSSGVDILNFTF